jgi:hypothetical protein
MLASWKLAPRKMNRISFNGKPKEPAELIADSVPKSLILG